MLIVSTCSITNKKKLINHWLWLLNGAKYNWVFASNLQPHSQLGSTNDVIKCQLRNMYSFCLLSFDFCELHTRKIEQEVPALMSNCQLIHDLSWFTMTHKKNWDFVPHQFQFVNSTWPMIVRCSWPFLGYVNSTPSSPWAKTKTLMAQSIEWRKLHC